MKNILWLDACDKFNADELGISMASPIWERVESRIFRAFEFGGQVKLWAASIDDDEKFRLHTHLGMESHPGECRLIYSPQKELGGRSKIREWWEPGDEPFRGTTNFLDHEWDDRTVCRDVSVALAMFRDFYEHHDLTETSLSQTRSVWDRKPR